MWQHQERAFSFSAGLEGSMLAMEMGTGKTLVAIELMKHWGARRVLVLCPKAVMGVWRRELDKWAPSHFYPLILDHKTQSSRQKAAEAIRVLDVIKD